MEIKNPYISVEIGENQFESLKNSLKKELEFLGFENIQELNNPHISVAYILGNKNLENLKEVVKELSESSFVMSVNGIKAIESSFYQGIIISLSLEHSDDFIYSQEFLKECISDNNVFLKEDFPGGFQAHISLFLLKDLSKELIELLPRYLEIALSSLKKEIIGEKFSIYNDDREKLIEMNFSK